MRGHRVEKLVVGQIEIVEAEYDIGLILLANGSRTARPAAAIIRAISSREGGVSNPYPARLAHAGLGVRYRLSAEHPTI